MIFILILLTTIISHLNAMHMHSLIQTINNFKEGKIGVHAINLNNPEKKFEVLADEYFPMASTRKIMLASYIFDLMEKRKLSLEECVSIRNKDVVSGTGIIKNDLHVSNAVRQYDLQELLELMMIESDNTAADILMKIGGGHEEVDKWLLANNIQNIHFKTDIKTWLRNQAIKTLRYKEAQNAIISSQQAPFLYKVIAHVASVLPEPNNINFSDETTNIATPRAMNEFLIKCYKGEAPGMQNEEHRRLLLEFMKNCKTGKNKIPKHLSNSALVMHKTGSGIVGICNDVAMVVSPQKTIAMTIFIKDSIKPMVELEEEIAKVAAEVYDAL